MSCHKGKAKTVCISKGSAQTGAASVALCQSEMAALLLHCGHHHRDGNGANLPARKLRTCHQILLCLPETPSLQEHSQCEAHLQFSRCPGGWASRENQSRGFGHLLLPRPGPTSVSHKEKGTFQAVTLAGRGGPLANMTTLLQINAISARISHLNTGQGGCITLPGFTLLRADPKSCERDSSSTQPCANKLCPTTF